MKTLLLSIALLVATVASCQLSTEDSLFGRKYFNQGYAINKATFEAIVKADPDGWAEIKKSKKHRYYARISDGVFVGFAAYAFFAKKNEFYYPALVAGLTGYVFDLKADKHIKAAINITNENMGFALNYRF